MNKVSEISSDLNKTGLLGKPSIIVIIFSICFSFWLVDFWRPINVFNYETVFNNPTVFKSYSYLPATFFKESNFLFPKTINSSLPTDTLINRVPDCNYGMAIIYFPSFIASLIRVGNSHQPDAGFTRTFSDAIHYGAIIYVLLGLIILRKILLCYFSEFATAFTLLLCLFGNTLLYYTFTQSELPQSHLFFLFVLFLRLSQLWHLKPNYFKTVLLALVLGVISLIYVSETYIVLFFLLWQVNNRESFLLRLHFFKTKYVHLIILFLIVLALWIPQYLFNLSHTGNLLGVSSKDEIHDFIDIKFNYLILNYKQGWLNYSPIMFLAIIGVFLIKPPLPVSKFLLLICLLLMFIIYGSYPYMGRGHYYGSMRLCASIAWFSLPLAFIIEKVYSLQAIHFRQAAIKLFVTLFLFSCICLNLLQTMQVIQHKLVPDRVTSEIYWDIFKTFKSKK